MNGGKSTGHAAASLSRGSYSEWRKYIPGSREWAVGSRTPGWPLGSRNLNFRIGVAVPARSFRRRFHMTSLSKNARIAGLLYIVGSIVGMLRPIYIPEKLFVHGNGSAT